VIDALHGLQLILALNPGLTLLCAGVLGALVGSFLNVVILRLPRRMEWEWRRDAHELLERSFDEPAHPSFFHGRSACPSCGHPIRWFENLPVLSWVALRGRCRGCGTSISAQYPLVEAGTGLLFALVVHHFGPTPAAAAGLVLTAALVAASGIDLRDRLLPDSIVLPLLWAGLLLSVGGVFVHPAQAIFGAAAGYLSLWSVFWLHHLLTGREGLGYGDFKLMAVAGAWFGPQAILPVVFLAACLISVLGLIHLRRTGQGADTHLPFGPAIGAAIWAWMLFGASHLGPWARQMGLP
jgi:leader peptidase (prepilin peptidase)/N-methyltransferase